MSTEYISVIECCSYHRIETAFLYSLQHAGLLEIVTEETREWIHVDQLPELERYIRWHYEMDINTEGIESIRHLLAKVTELQREVSGLKSRLRLYE